MILGESLMLRLSLVTSPVFCRQCDFLEEDADPSRPVFSPSFLHVAAGDLQQLMATFSHVYEADLRAYCCRDPPSFSTDADVFQRTQQLLTSFVRVQQAQLRLQTALKVPELVLCSSGAGGAEGGSCSPSVHKPGGGKAADAAELPGWRSQAHIL